MAKYLIINADDFGMSQIFNGVILDLIKKDLVRSTTVMVNRFGINQKKQFKELILLSKSKDLSVGLHLEFDNNDYSIQINGQFEKFKAIFGFKPSHIDIHKAHEIKESFKPVAEFCKKNNLPMRNQGISFKGVKSPVSQAFFASKINNFSEIEAWIKSFKDKNYYEIMFHPGKYDPHCKSSLNKERELDTKNIIQLNLILKKNNIKSVSYLDLN